MVSCSKHHLAKLWPVSSQFADQNGNTRPGTVVDKGITGVYVLSTLSKFRTSLTDLTDIYLQL